MTSKQDDQTLHRAYGAVAVVGLIGSVGALAWLGASWAWSVALGSLIAVVNLYVLARSVQRMLSGGQGGWAVVAVFKFLALMAVTYLAISSGVIVPLGLALGFGSLPLGILIASFTGPMVPQSDSRNTDHA